MHLKMIYLISIINCSSVKKMKKSFRVKNTVIYEIQISKMATYIKLIMSAPSRGHIWGIIEFFWKQVDSKMMITYYNRNINKSFSKKSYKNSVFDPRRQYWMSIHRIFRFFVDTSKLIVRPSLIILVVLQITAGWPPWN